jgi:hypothetical protein
VALTRDEARRIAANIATTKRIARLGPVRLDETESLLRGEKYYFAR